MTKVNEHPRVIAVLKLPNRVAALILVLRNIIAAMTGNAWFTSPSPTLAAVTTDTNNLETGHATALNKTKGAVSARDDKKVIVIKDAHALLAYVQGIADANPASAEAIILSAGMNVKSKGGKKKVEFTATHGSVSGVVNLATAVAESGASYEWQQSPDGVNWTNLPVTRKVKATVTNLTPGTLYYFRTRPVLRSGEGNWSQFVKIIAN